MTFYWLVMNVSLTTLSYAGYRTKEKAKQRGAKGYISTERSVMRLNRCVSCCSGIHSWCHEAEPTVNPAGSTSHAPDLL